MMPQVRALAVSRRLFSTAHYYTQKKMSDADNRAEFGRCHTRHGHGHNYVLELALEGEVDPATGFVLRTEDLDALLFEVCDPIDHTHVNFDLPEFRGDQLVPTTENLALYLRGKVHQVLRAKNWKVRLYRLRLFETEDLWVELFE